MSDIKIETRELKLWYGDARALNGISMAIPSNSVTSIIGPSGCGKSTFIRCLNRMNDTIPGCRTEGSTMIDGQDISSKGYDVIELRRQVGMVFQKPNPFPMSIHDNVTYGCRMAGINDGELLDRIAAKALSRAGLCHEVEDRQNDMATELSGGQQQRLCIARTLAMEPDILLMDEPCSALDPQSTSKIEELMLDLRNDYTVVVVTHNMQQAARVSDNTAFFYTGDLVEYGKTERIFNDPENDRTRQYIGGVFG